MKIVYLTSGPRGSGKSTFTKKVAGTSPEIILINRDDILIKLFGSTSLCPYSGGHHEGHRATFERIECELKSVGDSIVFLDYFNGFSSQRQKIINDLRELGADIIICLYFLIPLDTCIKWFMLKKDASGYSKHSVIRDYNLFYEKSSNITSDGFDKIIYIDPRQLYLPSFHVIKSL